MTSVLVAEGLRKSFGSLTAVDDVGLSISPGETYGLLGPNGAGKTTTISIIAGLLRPDAGDVTVGGESISVGSVQARAGIGLVPQELAIYPDLTGEENLTFFGRLYGMGGSNLAGRVGAVLEVIGLDDRRSDRSSEYSGGMQRRLNIGIGLLHQPQLLILDEPTVGVDPQSRNAILEAVEALSGEGMAVLYTTHYMEEAERLCDRVGIIDEGRLIAEGTRRQLVAQVGEVDRIDMKGHGDLGSAATAIAGLDGITGASVDEGSLFALARDASTILPAALAMAVAEGMTVTGVEIQQPDLEAVFLHLTGKALRD